MGRAPTGIQQIRPHGTQFQRPMPLQQAHPQYQQPQLQRPVQQPQMQQPGSALGPANPCRRSRPKFSKGPKEFFTAQKTNDARRSLRSFQQQQGEMFHEAFKRFNMMLKNCPHHGIQLWELLNAFHEGLSSEDARDLMSITNDTFGTNFEHDDWAFLEQMAVTSKRKAQSSRRARHVITRPQVHGVENGGVQTTNQVYNVCTNCNEIGHIAEVCLVGVVEDQVEEVNAIQGGGHNFNMNSNTYYPGLRNHPNFRYGNPTNQANPNFQGAQGNFAPRQQQCNQGNYRGRNNFGYQGQFQQSGGQSGSSGQTSSSGNEVMDMLRVMQQDMQKRNQLDEVRMQKDEVRDKSIQTVLRNGKEFKANLSPGLVDGVVEDITGNESDEDEVSPSIVSKDSNVEKVIQKPGLGEILKDKNEEGGPSQVPFPSALIDPGKKNFISTRGPQKEELWEVFKQVKVNLPLLDAIKQGPAYAKFLKELCTQKRQQKKKMPKRVDLTGQVSAVLKGDLPPKLQDPGTPLINIQVGNFQISKALLDLGA
ncbi:uncharacterized protein LOC110886127 [Helianthus annuus]|uniref:uncharacterized protein LOC110886127 n=1 Tax=Helianthus annuus TaxID=4232 RepID=UPI000B902883|nr:uncharacterized protein LOC110886127 [Helianthus annuus]